MKIIVRAIKYFFRKLGEIIYNVAVNLPYFHFIKNTKSNANACTFKIWFFQKVLGFNRDVYWPVDHRSKINQWKKIHIGIDVAPGIEPGCYIQGLGEVHIGDYTRIAQNVGIISANHKVEDLREYVRSKVVIGKYCWLGMNSVVLPGVVLGDHVVVAAGSVVTKSFEEGYCVVAGTPAKKIKDINPEECVNYENEYCYNGYIPTEQFDEFKKRNLWIEW